MPIRTEKKMKIKKPLFVLILLVLCLSSATSSFAIDVKIDFDRTTDFGRYKTFCWQKVGTRNPLWIERIRGSRGLGSDSERMESRRIRFCLRYSRSGNGNQTQP